MTHKEYVAHLIAFAAKHAPAVPDDAPDEPRVHGTIYWRWDHRGWGLDTRLTFDPDKRTAEISWSSTGRDVAHALAAITLYDQVVRFAASLEAYAAQFRDIERWDAKD